MTLPTSRLLRVRPTSFPPRFPSLVEELQRAVERRFLELLVHQVVLPTRPEGQGQPGPDAEEHGDKGASRIR